MQTLSINSAIRLGILVLIGFITLSDSFAADKSTEFPDATESDPAVLGWMVGSPPPEDRILRFDDGSYFRFPAMRWSVSNFRQLMPTVNVSRGLEAPAPLPRAMRDGIDAVRFTPLGRKNSMTWAESLSANYTDGIVVLHKGHIVYERYFGVFKEDGRHGAMSVTKSFVGTLGAMLVAEGVIEPNKRVAEYVPELANSAFGDATVRQVLDMTTALKFSEDYADPSAEVWGHARAGNPLPKPKDYTGPRSYFEFLQTVKKQGKHGEAFGYKTANTDALGWIIARITGRSIAGLLSEWIWRPLGAEQDAYFSVDSIGTPFAGGGLNTSLRDLARFGEMMRNDGKFNGRQIVPKTAVDDIRKGGDPARFAKAGYKLLKGWSYRNMWWVTHNEHGAFAARGVHGQTIYIDPKAEMVIARYASHPVAGNAENDPTSLPAYSTLAKYLMGKSDCAGTSSIGLAADHLQAFPLPGVGMTRHVLHLPVQEDESLRKVELIVGKTIETDLHNRYFFGGRIEAESIKGWGFTRYVVKGLGTIAGTRMAVPSNTPEAARFITLGGEPYFIRYNSQLPIVVYTPEGAEVRYRIWSPMGKTEAIPQG